MSQMIVGPRSSIFKRVSTLLVLVCSLAIAINLYIMHAENARQWYDIEAEQLGRSLTIQAAKLLAQPLSLENESLIENYINLIQEGSFIEGVVVFNDRGVRLNTMKETPSVLEMMSQNNYQPLVFVEDIVHEDKTLGYIKLTLNRDEIIQHHASFNRNQLSQTILIAMLAMIVAALLTRLFYKVKRNYDVDPDETKLL